MRPAREPNRTATGKRADDDTPATGENDNGEKTSRTACPSAATRTARPLAGTGDAMTPSIVGRQVGARLVRARYIHYDGYPTGVGRNVWRIARRDGPRRALRALTKNHYGWSSIRADQPDITGVLPFPDSPTNSPEQFASYLSPGGLFGNGHFVNVPKYGIAHTDDVIERNGETYQQVRADDIYTWDGGHLEAKAEWMYGIDIKHAAVSVYVIDKFSYPQRPVPELVVVLPIGTAEPDWAVIEQRGVALAHRACTTPQMR